jgi:2-dehydro-3-deoxygluconokinase
LWSSWDSAPQRELRSLVEHATILIGNHRDISLLLGRDFSGEGVERRRSAAAAAFEAFPNLQLIASTARSLVTAEHHKISARVDSRESYFQTAEIDITGIVERIGSGDAFAAGILHGWLSGSDLRGMAESGLALTALKHTIPGDQCLISKAELDAFSIVAADVRR